MPRSGTKQSTSTGRRPEKLSTSLRRRPRWTPAEQACSGSKGQSPTELCCQLPKLDFVAMPMTLSQLRTFLAVADAGSVSAAAESLFVSQPAVSAAIAKLERELGVTLVNRDGQGLRITAAGAAFGEDVRASLGLLDQAARRARSVDDPARGTVRIVAVATAAERMLLPAIAHFRERYPQASVTLRVGNRTTVWEALRHHEADLAMAGRPPAAIPAVVLARGENRLVAIGPSPKRPRGDDREALARIAHKTWLLREPGSGTLESARNLIDELGIDPTTMILGSNSAVLSAVELGLGVGLISLDAAEASIGRGAVTVWPCPGTPIDRPWHLAAHSAKPLSPTARALARSMIGGGGRRSLKVTVEGRRALRGSRVAPVDPR